MKKIKILVMSVLVAISININCKAMPISEFQVPDFSVLIGDKLYTLSYANDVDHIEEIRSDIVKCKGDIYIKTINNVWISNSLGKTVDSSMINSLDVNYFNGGKITSGIVNSKAVVRYIDSETGKDLLPSKEIVGKDGESLNIISPVINEYTVNGDSSKSIALTAELTNVTFMYSKGLGVQGTIVVKYVDESSGELISKSLYLKGSIGKSTVLDTKQIEGYSYRTTTGNFSGNFEKTEQIVTMIYKKTTLGTVDVSVINVNNVEILLEFNKPIDNLSNSQVLIDGNVCTLVERISDSKYNIISNKQLEGIESYKIDLVKLSSKGVSLSDISKTVTVTTSVNKELEQISESLQNITNLYSVNNKIFLLDISNELIDVTGINYLEQIPKTLTINGIKPLRVEKVDSFMGTGETSFEIVMGDKVSDNPEIKVTGLYLKSDTSSVKNTNFNKIIEQKLFMLTNYERVLKISSTSSINLSNYFEEGSYDSLSMIYAEADNKFDAIFTGSNISVAKSKEGFAWDDILIASRKEGHWGKIIRIQVVLP